MVSREYEALLKAALVAACGSVLSAVAPPAIASTLLTGVIRDQRGAAIPGARVTVRDRAGRIVGADTAASDGTFATEMDAAAVSLDVSCDDCVPVRRALDPGGEPLVIFVRRYSAVRQRGPSAVDLRALPYRDAAAVASLVPFSVDADGRLSDRGLAPYAATLVDGLPFYDPADGDAFIRLIPAHALAGLATAPPADAPVYGGYAAAGLDDLRLDDPDAPAGRADGGAAASDVVVRANGVPFAATLAASDDPGDRRAVGAARARLPFAGGTLGVTAVSLGGIAADASGAGLAYATDARRSSIAAALSATRTTTSSYLTADVHVRERSPLALEFGARADRATSAIGGGAQADAAVYAAAATTAGPATVTARAAYDVGSDAGEDAAARSGALTGSLGSEMRVSEWWSVRTDVVSAVRVPTLGEAAAEGPGPAAGRRSLLVEQAATYADRRRLRVDALLYTQRSTGGATAHVAGFGIDAGWQIAPRLALRSWLLRGDAAEPESGGPYAGATAPGMPSRLARQVVWLTYDAGLRVDALVRGGALEGDVRIPLGPVVALALGSARSNRARLTTLGLTLR